MLITKKTKIIEGVEFKDADFNALIQNGEPYILKGALRNAPLVIAGMQSYAKAKSHLLSYAGNQPFLSYVADASANGRFFYNEDISGLNFSTEYLSLDDFFKKNRNLEKKYRRYVFLCGLCRLRTTFSWAA